MRGDALGVLVDRCSRGVHHDAVHWARRHAQLAAGAQQLDHGMHVLARANDGVDRARLDALGATDAVGFDNHCDLRRFVLATRAVERFRSDVEYVRQCTCSGVAAGWAAIDVNPACGQGFGVRATTGIAALAALRLRQDAVKTFDEIGCCHVQDDGLFHRHARLRTAVDVQQMQAVAVETGGQDHAFADAEAHLARCEVGDEHHVASNQLPGLTITGADAGKDLALAEIAGVEFEPQQLVGAFDEFANQHGADAQVELGEIVNADGGICRRDVSRNRSRACSNGRS